MLRADSNRREREHTAWRSGGLAVANLISSPKPKMARAAVGRCAFDYFVSTITNHNVTNRRKNSRLLRQDHDSEVPSAFQRLSEVELATRM